MTGQTISHYKILEKIGSGGMGEVWKAEDLKLGRHVALKFLASHLVSDAETLKRFEREAKAAASLSHPNICTVHEIDEADGKAFLAMEFVKGEALDARIEKGPMPLSDALDLGRQIAEGLQEAHAAGIVHRDIKPGNILVTPEGRAKILDFGLALLTEGSKLTKFDTTVGTVAYMSPEQAQGAEVDHRTDIWALGVVLYEMVAGVRPFKGQYDQALLYEIVNEQPEPLTGIRAGLPMELEIFVAKCLAKDAGDRYQNAGDMIVDLRAVSRRLESDTVRSVVRSRVSPSARESSVALVQPEKSTNRIVFTLAIGCLLLAALSAIQWVGFSAANGITEVRHFAFTLDQAAHHTAISPNGRYLAYTTGSDFGGDLWIQDLTSGSTRNLVEAGDLVMSPFWSPNSNYLAFFFPDGLRKIAVPEGTPEAVVTGAAGSSFFGGTWTPDGTSIIDSARSPARLFRVSAVGGEPELLFSPDPFGPVEYLRFPTFPLADDAPNKLSFQFRNAASGSQTLRVADLLGSETVDLGLGVQRHVRAPTGHWIFESFDPNSGWRLFGAPATGAELKPTGPQFRIRDSARYPSVSRDGSLAFVELGKGTQQLVWADRGGGRLGSIGQSQAGIGFARLSRDGRQVAVNSGYGGASDVWVHETNRPIARRVTRDAAADRRPLWSPRADEIVFSSFRDSGEAIYMTSSGGSEGAKLIFDTKDRRELIHDWSPSGKYIVFHVENPAPQRRDLWYIERSQGEWKAQPFVETEAEERVAVFSPDERYLAYVSDESGRDEVYVKPFPSGDNKWQISENGGTQPRWAGDELFFVNGDVLHAARVSVDGEFRVLSTERLFRDPALVNGFAFQTYDVDSDGQRFVLVDTVYDGPASIIHVVLNWGARLVDER